MNKKKYFENDEPVLTEDQEKELYGEIPEEATSVVPQTHGVEENYETGDKNIQEE